MVPVGLASLRTAVWRIVEVVVVAVKVCCDIFLNNGRTGHEWRWWHASIMDVLL